MNGKTVRKTRRDSRIFFTSRNKAVSLFSAVSGLVANPFRENRSLSRQWVASAGKTKTAPPPGKVTRPDQIALEVRHG